MEFQKSGKIHFHLLLSTPYRKQLHISIVALWATLQEPLNCQYCSLKDKSKGLVRMTQEAVVKANLRGRMWENLRTEEGAKRYALKYCLKPGQKKPPLWLNHTGRFWGSDRETGKVDYSEWQILPVTEEQTRLYLSIDNHPAAKFDILPKYLWNIG